MRLLSNLLRRFIRQGTLRVRDVDGKQHVFGNRVPGPDVAIHLHDRKLYIRLFINPELYAAEAYMDGTLTLEGGVKIHDFLLLFSVNRAGLYSYGSQKLMRRIWRGLRRWHQANPIGLAAAHARHHYDISSKLYSLFLDDQMQYSCAYFRDPEHDTLEQAQRYKLTHATAKLQLKPDMTVAEIGSGWGGFAIHLARETGCYVTAVNVSPEQIKTARARAEAAGVSNRVEFRELDYRQLTGHFDRVVSVGMMEHVGIGHFDEYFLKIRELLTPDGYAFIHCIGRMSQPGTTGPFIRKYIFPGAYVPALSETFAATERCGLWCDDMEVLRLHYRYTVKHWRERFAKKPRPGRGDVRRAVLPDVGILSRRRRTRVPSRLAYGIPIAAFDPTRFSPDHARFHGRRRAGGLREEGWLNDAAPANARCPRYSGHCSVSSLCPYSHKR